MEHFQISSTPFATSPPTGAICQVSNIRVLGQEDEDELCRIFLTLEPSARYSRFGRAASDASMVDHAKRSLANADWIVGAFIGERIRGVVEIYGGEPSAYFEAAFVVEREWRRLGLGWGLLQAAIQKASGCEANTLRMVFSRHNWPMRKLASKASAKLDIVLDEMCVDVLLDGSTKISLD
jgi:GNAT superfamily N-acetyltransferase